MLLSNFSIRQPVTTVVVVIALMCLGLLALKNLRVNQMPDVEQPVIVVTFPYPGASPETVERASLPDSFRAGWLVFESDDELRRVAPIPEKWEELDTDTLRELCFKAPSAPRRMTGKDRSSPSANA